MTTMNIVLAATDAKLAAAWRNAFADFAAVSVQEGSIFEVSCDALISPANSVGFMDGGIDALYTDRFGCDVQLRFRRLILDRHNGELLVGQAEIIETGDASHPYLIVAPTMRVPMVLDRKSINPFLATRAALLLVKRGRFSAGSLAGNAISSHIRTVAFPGMGTGVGRLPASICARQMRIAFDETWLD